MALLEELCAVHTYNTTESGIEVSLSLNPQHKLYDGHFPEQSITPGIIQLYLVKAFLSKHLRKTILLRKLKNCKFLAVLDPDVTTKISLSIQVKKLDSSYDIAAKISCDKQNYFKLKAIYN